MLLATLIIVLILLGFLIIFFPNKTLFVLLFLGLVSLGYVIIKIPVVSVFILIPITMLSFVTYQNFSKLRDEDVQKSRLFSASFKDHFFGRNIIDEEVSLFGLSEGMEDDFKRVGRLPNEFYRNAFKQKNH